MKIKTCSKCKKRKKISEFYKDKNKKDKHSCICKLCSSNYTKRYYQENREQVNKQHKDYYLKNKKRIYENKRDYFKKHKKRIKQQSKIYRKKNHKKLCKKKREYYKDNKEKILKYHKIYYKKNKLKKLKYAKKYHINNKKKRVEYNVEYRRKRRNENIDIRVRDRLSKRIWDAVKGNYKSKSTLKLLGCSVEELKNHLKKQFKKGMTWDNYGFYGWHIDHIIPCCKFDLSKPKEQAKCFHYTNLQPLWAEENWSKNRS